MLSLGIDAGTYSWKTCVMGKGIELKSFKKMDLVLEYLEKVFRKNPDIPTVLPSGFGCPLKKSKELTGRDIFEMTLKKEDTEVVGLGRFLGISRDFENAYVIPSVKLLPTVPPYRKLNKIDMGTSDKVCSVAFLLSKGFRDFLMLEIGYGFTAIIVCKGGKIVDGVGGTNILGGRCRGRIDGEIAYLFDFSKEDIYSGGFEDLEKRFGLGKKAFLEEVNKKILMFKSFYNISEVVVTGRRKNFDFEFKSFNKGFESAIGASILANGISGGEYEWIVELLEIRKARERVFSWILPPRNPPSFFSPEEKY